MNYPAQYLNIITIPVNTHTKDRAQNWNIIDIIKNITSLNKCLLQSSLSDTWCCRINFNLKQLSKIFTHHPKSNGETYFEHMRCASYYGFKMVVSGLAAIVHSIFPFLFETAASDCAKMVNKEVERRKHEAALKWKIFPIKLL